MNIAPTMANINQLIGTARRANAPVFAVRHTGPQGSPAAEHGRCSILPNLCQPPKDRSLRQLLQGAAYTRDIQAYANP